MIKKCVVFLGYATGEGEMVPTATGFLVNINSIFHLVTAKHVIHNKASNLPTDENMFIFLNGMDGEIYGRTIKEIKQMYKVNWIFHKDREVDVAIIPFGLDDATDDVRFIPNSLFQGVDHLYETYEVFFLSYQPGITFKKRISPIIRTGMISLMNEDKTFFIDAPAFPGNSGGSVFLQPSLLFDKSVSTIGGGKLIGIIGSYLPYEDRAYSRQTGNLRVVFEENTDLSKVWGVSFLNDIIESEEFKDQVTKIGKLNPQ